MPQETGSNALGKRKLPAEQKSSNKGADTTAHQWSKQDLHVFVVASKDVDAVVHALAAENVHVVHDEPLDENDWDESDSSEDDGHEDDSLGG